MGEKYEVFIDIAVVNHKVTVKVSMEIISNCMP